MRRKEEIRKTTFNELLNKKLVKFYVIVHVVTVKMPIKKNENIININIYILYGVDIRGQKTILGIYKENKNDNRFWLEKLEYIKSRNLEKILFVSMEPNKKLEQAFKILYNNVKIIPSAVNIVSCIAVFTHYEWQSDSEREMVRSFLCENIEECEEVLNGIKEKYSENKVATVLIDKYSDDIKAYYKYEREFRHLFCSYFTIKIMKNNILRLNKTQNVYENLESIFENLLDYYTLFERTRSYTKKEWVKILNEIYLKFGNEIGEYII